MIKFIATDLDGTFLTSKKEKPSDFKEIFDEMCRRNIIFAVASGRDYNGASMYFDGYKDKMTFICDNGASIYKDGKLITARTMSKEKYLKLIDIFESMGMKDLLVCGVNGSYVQSTSSEDYINKMHSHYTKNIIVDDLRNVDDEIFKVSAIDLSGTTLKDRIYTPLTKSELRAELTIHMSGTRFLDVMDIKANKGIGIAEIQEKFGISRNETMVFGDYYNDEPLFESADYAFVMRGAPDDLKAKYQYHAGSCDEDGVTKAIKEWAFDKIK